MKKAWCVALTALLLFLSLSSLSSCDRQRELTDRELMRSGATALVSFLSELYTSGTGITEKDFAKLSAASLTESQLSLRVDEVTVGTQTLISQNAPLLLDIVGHADQTTGKFSLQALLEMFGELLTVNVYRDADALLLELPELYNRYIKLADGYDAGALSSLSGEVWGNLASEVVRDEYFHRETLDYTYDDVGVKNATRLTLDLSAVNFSEVALSLLKKAERVIPDEAYDSIFPEVEKFFENNEIKLSECRFVFWFNGNHLIGGECSAAYGGKRVSVDFTMNKTGAFYALRGKIRTGAGEDETELFAFEWNQTVKGSTKNGTLDLTMLPVRKSSSGSEQSGTNYGEPERLFLKTTFFTDIDGNRQNADIFVNVGYEMYGILSSFNIPLHLVTDCEDGIFSATLSLNDSFLEFSTVKAQLSMSVKPSDSALRLPSPEKHDIFDIRTDPLVELFTTLLEALKTQFPQFYVNFFGGYEDEDNGFGTLILSSEGDPRVYSLLIDRSDFDSGKIFGEGSYTCACSFRQKGAVYTITLAGDDRSYDIDTSDTDEYDLVRLEDTVMIADTDGNQWSLSDTDGTGYTNRPFEYMMDFSNDAEGVLTFTLADGAELFRNAAFKIENGHFWIDGKAYLFVSDFLR